MIRVTFCKGHSRYRVETGLESEAEGGRKRNPWNSGRKRGRCGLDVSGGGGKNEPPPGGVFRTQLWRTGG